jgi:hypothetical protein
MIAEGFAWRGLSDEERLARQFPIYDALFEYVRRRVAAEARATE